jgi:hypothetical protein
MRILKGAAGAITTQSLRAFDDLLLGVRNGELKIEVVNVLAAKFLQPLERVPHRIKRRAQPNIAANLF